MENDFKQVLSAAGVEDETIEKLLELAGLDPQDSYPSSYALDNVVAVLERLSAFREKFHRSKGRPSKYGFKDIEVGEHKIYEVASKTGSHEEYYKNCQRIYNAVLQFNSKYRRTLMIDHNIKPGFAVVTRLA